MARRFVYSISTGRSGTVFFRDFLQANMTDAEAWHERTAWSDFGVTTPDASHLLHFNHVGNDQHVQNFWRQKLASDQNTAAAWHIEISHFLSKAGLIENLHQLLAHADAIHIINLKRDVLKIFWSFANRFSFANYGFTWLFTLDPRYPNVILNSRPYLRYGMFGTALWYVLEMNCRAEYYKQLFRDVPNLHFHTVYLEDILQQPQAVDLLTRLDGQTRTEAIIPSQANESKNFHFGEAEFEQCKKLVADLNVDAEALAREFIQSGKRLEFGARQKSFRINWKK